MMVGPASNTKPSCLNTYARPPGRSRFSTTTTSCPWAWSRIAALSPPNPAPMTTMRIVENEFGGHSLEQVLPNVGLLCYRLANIRDRGQPMKVEVVDAARKAYASTGNAITLGAVLHEGECHPEPIVQIPLAMLNRHGLIAGATGTGKTRTLQLVAEQLSRAGVPVFLSDVKGDLSGVGAAGTPNERIDKRLKDTGFAWNPSAFPVEFLSLTGKSGAQLRATVSTFGPLLL